MAEVRCPVRPVLRLMDGCEWAGREGQINTGLGERTFFQG